MIKSKNADKLDEGTKRTRSLRALLFALRQWQAYHRRTFLLKKVKSVDLDGCVVDLEGLPNLSTKVALLTKTYEEFERRAVLQYVRSDLPVIELGGCIGVLGCVANKLLRDPTAHVVIELNPLAVPYLKAARSRNGCKFEIVNAAIAYDRESITFVPSKDFWLNSLEQTDSGEPVTVRTIELGEIVKQRKFGPFTLICDIEGHEYDLVRRETDTLRGADTIILETHARFIGEEKTTELRHRL